MEAKVSVLCKKKGMKALNIHKIEAFDIMDAYKYIGIDIPCSLIMNDYIKSLEMKSKFFTQTTDKLSIAKSQTRAVEGFCFDPPDLCLWNSSALIPAKLKPSKPYVHEKPEESLQITQLHTQSTCT